MSRPTLEAGDIVAALFMVTHTRQDPGTPRRLLVHQVNEQGTTINHGITFEFSEGDLQLVRHVQAPAIDYEHPDRFVDPGPQPKLEEVWLIYWKASPTETFWYLKPTDGQMPNFRWTSRRDRATPVLTLGLVLMTMSLLEGAGFDGVASIVVLAPVQEPQVAAGVPVAPVLAAPGPWAGDPRVFVRTPDVQSLEESAAVAVGYLVGAKAQDGQEIYYEGSPSMTWTRLRERAHVFLTAAQAHAMRRKLGDRAGNVNELRVMASTAGGWSSVAPAAPPG